MVRSQLSREHWYCGDLGANTRPYCYIFFNKTSGVEVLQDCVLFSLFMSSSFVASTALLYFCFVF